VWKRFAQALRCPICNGGLELRTLSAHSVELSAQALAVMERRGLRAGDCSEYVEAGLLVCPACKLRFPVMHGLPVMLPYITPLHEEFDARFDRAGLADGLSFPQHQPAAGEEFVRASFSTEWLEYDYDGVIWELSYDAHATRIALEVGPAIEGDIKWHLEVGCGLGLAAKVVQQHTRCDAVGLDLSLAALKAAKHFREDPFMHFVQASAFAIPFAADQFDLIYSRGVLHHTYSTEKAFRSVAKHCKPGGTFYVWLYGPGSIRSTPLRVGLFALESMTRPAVAQAPDSAIAKAFLRTMALGYVSFNRLRRLGNPEIQPLSFARGLHAARDRFTPRFAHRHPPEEILGWFAAAGYKTPEVLDWHSMPPAEQEDFRRNVGIRAVRAA
jgi:SAM-dependent methyltransferase/uncharacterized protein YbaR (Trm112 family)